MGLTRLLHLLRLLLQHLLRLLLQRLLLHLSKEGVISSALNEIAPRQAPHPIRGAIRKARDAETARRNQELARAIFRELNGMRRSTRTPGEHRAGLAKDEVETFVEYQLRLGGPRGARQWLIAPGTRGKGKQADQLTPESDTSYGDMSVSTDVEDGSSDSDSDSDYEFE